MTVLFNTGRSTSGDGQAEATGQLTRAGYPVTEVCVRQDGEDPVAGKQRCRKKFAGEG